VREPVSRSKSGVQGKVADVFAGRSRHAESQNELKAFRILMATGRSDAWQEQPFCLEYHNGGAQHRYTPDILIAWGAHQEVVEIKEDHDAESPENQARFTLIRKLLAEHGFCFRLRCEQRGVRVNSAGAAAAVISAGETAVLNGECLQKSASPVVVQNYDPLVNSGEISGFFSILPTGWLKRFSASAMYRLLHMRVFCSGQISIHPWHHGLRLILQPVCRLQPFARTGT
jgi:hypothetical protein